MLELKIVRWQKPKRPSEEELRRKYLQERLSPYRWSNAPGDYYPPHSHGYHKVLYVVSGTITWILPESNQEILAEPGDRLELPAGTIHAARVGSEGVVCLEAHVF